MSLVACVPGCAPSEISTRLEAVRASTARWRSQGFREILLV